MVDIETRDSMSLEKLEHPKTVSSSGEIREEPIYRTMKLG